MYGEGVFRLNLGMLWSLHPDHQCDLMYSLILTDFISPVTCYYMKNHACYIRRKIFYLPPNTQYLCHLRFILPWTRDKPPISYAVQKDSKNVNITSASHLVFTILNSFKLLE